MTKLVIVLTIEQSAIPQGEDTRVLRRGEIKINGSGGRFSSFLRVFEIALISSSILSLMAWVHPYVEISL